MTRRILTWIREMDEAPFARFFAERPGVRLENARRTPVELESMDALLLTGGEDVSAGYLRQPLTAEAAALIQEDFDPVRDAFEFEAVREAIERRVPILAICRGMQVFNVALGGTLHLDIPGHDLPELKSNNVQRLRFGTEPTVRFERVNSSHHQALDRLGEGLEVEAWCASDHVIEQVRLADYPWAVGVQFHPERDASYRPLFEMFLEKVEPLDQ